MIDVRVLPSAYDEIARLDGGDQRRVMGGLLALREGHQVGRPIAGGETPIMLYETYGFAIAYVAFGQSMWITEVGDGSRDRSSRIQELLAFLESTEDEVRQGLLRSSLEMLGTA